MIQYGEKLVQYGVIRWIGRLPNEKEIQVGLEMVRPSIYLSVLLLHAV